MTWNFQLKILYCQTYPVNLLISMAILVLNPLQTGLLTSLQLRFTKLQMQPKYQFQITNHTLLPLVKAHISQLTTLGGRKQSTSQASNPISSKSKSKSTSKLKRLKLLPQDQHPLRRNAMDYQS